MPDRTPAPYASTRLTLRAWTAEDVDDHFAIYSRWEVARWLGAAPRALGSAEESAASIKRWAGRRDDPYGIWAVVPHDVGRPVGSVLLVHLPDADGRPTSDVEVGWHLHPDVWGRGYATEGAGVLLEQAWADGLDRVWAVVYPGNEASVAVTRRLGMAPTGRTSRWYGVELDAFAVDRPDHQGP